MGRLQPAAAGHGAEEGYLHKKYRAAGARVLCLPFLRWTRRRSALPVASDPAALCRDRLLAWEEGGAGGGTGRRPLP
ncbi:hypothetical protein GCM10020221_31230 [Streptomyces thioluteus]|uniref:Uncharacterized protein n=1 Tax=Streptomyces thioluteus TaxID=66431 RepID=A0ABN3WZX2_STRTU